MISLRSKITQQVLSDAFLNEKKAFYVNEIARRYHLDSGNVTRKLRELEAAGILRSEMKGTTKLYSLNLKFSLIKEYRHIVLKTAGIENTLRKTLKSIKDVDKAVLFGSYASDKMDASSDLDLLVIGDHRLIDLHRQIAKLQKETGREINVISLSPAEYKKKCKSEVFFKTLDKNPKVILFDAL